MRIQNWESTLEAFIQSRLGTPFIWGENDCCLFACDAVALITGIDPAKTWRGKYNNRESALHLAQVRNCNSVYDIAKSMADEYGFQEQSPKMVTRGDIICHRSLNPQGLGQTLAVVGSGVVYGPGDSGLITTKLDTIWNFTHTKAWKIV